MDKHIEAIGKLHPLCSFGFFLMLSVLIISIVLMVFWIIKNKDIKLKHVEIVSKTEKEYLKAEGKNTLDNQTSNAHNLLKKIWIDLYETGRKKFNIIDPTEKYLLEDIAHIIEGKLNYEVKNDLTRNHITEKNDVELSKYSEAKAAGYYRSVKANLYNFNAQLPMYDLPLILDDISYDDFKDVFSEIYFSARKIAGGY